MLHLKTFGGLSVDSDSAPGTGAAQQRKTLALLALVAVAGDRGVSRDKLIAFLWPETDAAHGRGLLKQACYALRRDLQAPELFRGSTELRLNTAVISSDVGSFAAALERNDPSTAVSCYAAPFLDGFYLNGGGEFERWVETERARLASQYGAALEALAVAATQRGDHRVATDWWRRRLDLDALNSRAALGLMTALDQAGERAEALRCGEVYSELVRSELGADPPSDLSEWIEQHRHATAPSNHRSATRPAAASEPVVDVPRRSSVTSRRWGVGVGLAVLATTAIVLSRSGSPSPIDPNLLAIAPFDVLDPSLEIWREGLVDILSRDLDGAGPLRTVPQTVGLKRWRGRADRVSAASFGYGAGAGLVVFGSVGKTRDTVSLRATVLEVAKQSAVAEIEVRGDTAAVGDLADSLGVGILRALGRNRPIGAVRRVSIGSRSLPALRAFLFGEQFYRRGLWDSALVYYDRAIGQDSTLAVAYRHMRLVLDWHPSSATAYRPTEEYLRQSIRRYGGLSPKDSMMVAADSFGVAAADATDPTDLVRFSYRRLSTFEEAARRYPGDPEVWYELGDARYHNGPPLGGVPAAALEAFDRAIALDPGFAPAYEHTVELALRLNRPDLARKYADAYLRLDPTDVNAPAIRLAAVMLDPTRSHAPETARTIDSVSASLLFDVGMGNLGWWSDSGEAGVRLLRALSLRGDAALDDAADPVMAHQYLAYELAYRGHLQEAYAEDRRLLLDQTASRFSSYFDPFVSLSLLGVIPDSLAAATYARAFEPGKAWPMLLFGNVRQLHGLNWWLARRDTASIARFAQRAEREVRSQPSARGRLRSRYFHAAATAYLALARGDSVGALRLLQAIPDTLCLEHYDCVFGKLTEARLLHALGQARRAGAILDGWIWRDHSPLLVLSVLERGRIAEELGERQKAIDSYRFVVDVWHRADPQLQPFVIESRRALARMTRE